MSERIPGLLGVAAMEIALSELFEGYRWTCVRWRIWAAIFARKCWTQPRFNMTKEDEIRLRHMADAAREVASFSAGRTRGDLDDDRQLVMALVNAEHTRKTPYGPD